MELIFGIRHRGLWTLVLHNNCHPCMILYDAVMNFHYFVFSIPCIFQKARLSNTLPNTLLSPHHHTFSMHNIQNLVENNLSNQIQSNLNKWWDKFILNCLNQTLVLRVCLYHGYSKHTFTVSTVLEKHSQDVTVQLCYTVC